MDTQRTEQLPIRMWWGVATIGTLALAAMLFLTVPGAGYVVAFLTGGAIGFVLGILVGIEEATRPPAEFIKPPPLEEWGPGHRIPVRSVDPPLHLVNQEHWAGDNVVRLPVPLSETPRSVLVELEETLLRAHADLMHPAQGPEERDHRSSMAVGVALALDLVRAKTETLGA